MNAPLVLKRKQFLPSSRERRIAGVLFVALLTAGVVVFYPLFAQLDWSRAPEKLLSGYGPFGELVAAGLVGVLHFWYARRAKKLERLFLDEREIRFQSALPGWLAFVQPSWAHSWAQIVSVRVVMPKLAFHPNMVALVIDAVTVQRKLPAQWIPEDREENSSGTGLFAFSSHAEVAAQIARDIDQSVVVRHMRQLGVKVEMSEAPRVGFALERNRATLVALVLIFAFIVYAIGDFMLNSETYAVKPPVVLYVLAGAVAMLGCGLVLTANEVPHAETWAVSVVLGATFAAALYPALLRINQLTDAGGLKPQQYRLEDYVVFKPLDARLPDLVFHDYHEYWQQFPRGSQHEFLMRRGALGFDQVDMGPVHARMRDFYRNQP